jgi:hypothetical protein
MNEYVVVKGMTEEMMGPQHSEMEIRRMGVFLLVGTMPRGHGHHLLRRHPDLGELGEDPPKKVPGGVTSVAALMEVRGW